MYNFERHVSLVLGQRCPWIIQLDFSWLSQPKNARLQALIRFIRTIVQNRSYRHVYFVSLEKALEWMKYPRPISEIGDFWPFLCNDPQRVITTDCSSNEIIERSGKIVDVDRLTDTENKTNRSKSLFVDLAGEKLFPNGLAFHIIWIFILLVLTVLFYDKYLSRH